MDLERRASVERKHEKLQFVVPISRIIIVLLMHASMIVSALLDGTPIKANIIMPAILAIAIGEALCVKMRDNASAEPYKKLICVSNVLAASVSFAANGWSPWAVALIATTYIDDSYALYASAAYLVPWLLSALFSEDAMLALDSVLAVLAAASAYVSITTIEEYRAEISKAALRRTIEILKAKLGILEDCNKSAYYDPLTSALNRRGFKKALDEIRNIGERTRYGMLMIDIDHFKSINDTYGHDVGDRVLQAMSSMLLGHLRPSDDLIVRMGGEEFLVLLYDLHNEKDVYLVGERLRRSIEAHSEEVSGIKFTVSIGATIVKDLADIEHCIKRADEALYESKRTGRNKITVRL